MKKDDDIRQFMMTGKDFIQHLQKQFPSKVMCLLAMLFPQRELSLILIGLEGQVQNMKSGNGEDTCYKHD